MTDYKAEILKVYPDAWCYDINWSKRFAFSNYHLYKIVSQDGTVNLSNCEYSEDTAWKKAYEQHLNKSYNMAFRKLASIQEIKEIKLIPKADMIEVAVVNGWEVVVKKGEYQVGNICVYCEIDSFLPIREEYEFLRKSSYRTMGDEEGFALRTIELRKQISQGLILNTTMIPGNKNIDKTDIGTDVTELLGIKLYEKPLPSELLAQASGYLHSSVKNTSQDRIQNLVDEYDELREYIYTETEKLDGQSFSAYYDREKDAVNVASKDVSFIESDDNSFWKAAKSINLPEILRRYAADSNDDIAIQGELIGGKYGFNESTVRFFRIVDRNTKKVLGFEYFMNFLKQHNLKSVPILKTDYKLPIDYRDLLAEANFISHLWDKRKAEGIILCSTCGTKSFKVISNNFLLTNQE